MPFAKQLIRALMDTLQLGPLSERLQQTLEGRIAEVIDEQIEQALVDTVTEEDWRFFDHYKTQHPDAGEGGALDAMIDRRPEIKSAIEARVKAACDDVVLKSEAAVQAVEENGAL